MTNIRNLLSACCLLAAVAMGMVSCDKYNYTADLQKLGQRVEVLEQMVLETNTEITVLNELIMAIQNRGYVTQVVHNTDGSYTITFNTGKTFTLRQGRNGQDGRDGRDVELNIGVAKDEQDGRWYWTLDGQWILDGDGNRMPAGATDGRDGRDGLDGRDGRDGIDGVDGVDGRDGVNGRDGHDGHDGKNDTAVIPQVRINPTTRNWEISTDGGSTWNDTGVCADGRDGQDGQDGQDDLFLEIIESPDGQFITFVLRDGRVFTVPVVP